MNGVTFGTKHSYKDFNLLLRKVEIGIPKVKTETIEDVKGINGIIDLTESLGEINYENRLLKFTFVVIGRNNFYSTLTNISNYLHGQNMQVIIDYDRSYYYTGRCSVNEMESEQKTATIVIDANVFPYKFDINFESDNWLWNPFSFVDGVIRNHSYEVNGSLNLELTGLKMITSPTFTTENSGMAVVFDGKTYSIPVGTTKMYSIRLQEGINYLTLTGNGTVKIIYQGGVL